MMTEKYEVGDLVYYSSVEGIKIALITKVKKLLKLYDILIQTENVYIKDVHISYLQKAI
jgi:hypothetical protein